MRNLDFRKPIYVLLYHPWAEGFERDFPVQLSWLKDHRFKTISLEHLLGYVKGREVGVPERPVVITLDDGSIESYTVAYPLLKRFGFAGTVFAPTAEKYLRLSGKDWWKEVESEKVLGIEGHSHTHAYTFVSDRVDDFYVEEREVRAPVVKRLDARPGAPIFELGYELVSRQFVPSKKFVDLCVDYVSGQGDHFFERDHWREELMGLASRYRGKRGRFESEKLRGSRVREELKLSKRIIEDALGGGKKVHFFAYPFGAYDATLVRQVKETGYLGAFTTVPGGNLPGGDPFLIRRVTMQAGMGPAELEGIFREYL